MPMESDTSIKDTVMLRYKQSEFNEKSSEVTRTSNELKIARGKVNYYLSEIERLNKKLGADLKEREIALEEYRGCKEDFVQEQINKAEKQLKD